MAGIKSLRRETSIRAVKRKRKRRGRRCLNFFIPGADFKDSRCPYINSLEEDVVRTLCLSLLMSAFK